MNVTVFPGQHIKIAVPTGLYDAMRVCLSGRDAQVGIQVGGQGQWRATGPEGTVNTVLHHGEIRSVSLNRFSDDVIDVDNGIDPNPGLASPVSVTLYRVPTS